MKKELFYDELLKFLENGTVSFTVVKLLKEELIRNGYQEVTEIQKLDLKPGNYFITRNDATIIALQIPKEKASSFMITTTHCDTPSLELKAQGEVVSNGFLKYNVMPYGGLLNYGWLDRPLSLAGRVTTLKDNVIKKEIIDLKDAIGIVPSVAIHQNDKANSNLDLNMQVDLQPILSLEKKKIDFKEYLTKKLNLSDSIKDFDLYLYNCEKPLIIGLNKDILVSPRIDNLTSTFAAFKGFLESNNNQVNVFVSFNNEEIGSLTKEGAESSFLIDILKKICGSLEMDLYTTLANSFVVSSDNTHAIHPNHPEFMDESGNISLNQGIAIIKESTSTTDGYFSTIFKAICDKAKVKYQDYSMKNDLSTGSTLAGLSLRHVSVSSIDIGIGQLAMHSSYECCGLLDVFYLYLALKQFYRTDINIVKDKTKLVFH